MAVSYTHLDVYKRQNHELEDFKQKKQEERTEAYERRDAAALRDAKRGHKARIGYARIVLAVSYTHLDVYKRQALNGMEAHLKKLTQEISEIEKQQENTRQELEKPFACLLYTSRCV